MYAVKIKRKIERKLERMPIRVQETFLKLVKNLEENGPVQPAWPNYGKLEDQAHHCHLTYHYVACWRHERGTITLEVYYVGSREKAPY